MRLCIVAFATMAMLLNGPVAVADLPSPGAGSAAGADHTYPISGAQSSAAADRYIQDWGAGGGH